MHCCHPRGGPASHAPPPGTTPPTPRRSRLRRAARRAAAAIKWAVPITTLALIPKCPICVAGYVMAMSGLGVTLTQASALRSAMIWLSCLALGYLLVRASLRLVHSISKRNADASLDPGA